MTRADKRRQILRAAERLFVTHRYDEVTLDEVSRTARVGKGTIYRYFADKEDLYAQMVLQGQIDLIEAVRTAAAKPKPADVKLAGVVRIAGRLFRKRQGRVQAAQAADFRRMVHNGKLHAEMAGKRRELVGVLADIIRQGVGEGMFRSDVPPDAGAVMFLGMMRAMLWAGRAEQAPAMSLDRMAGVFLDGMRKG